MATREARFRQAAVAYLVYGLVYMSGAVYLAGQGIGARGMAATTPGVAWFLLGTLFILVFPWLIVRGARARGPLWFTRVLTLLLAYRAFEVGRVALRPRVGTVPLPGGGEMTLATGAWVFCLITLAVLVMLGRAAWSRG